MKRQRITKGSILEIHIDNEYYIYAQILGNASCVFFDYKSTIPLIDLTPLKFAPMLFIIAVYNDVITRGEWLKVGKMEIREEFKILPLAYIKDVDGYFRLYNPNTGEISPATKEQCKGLEVAAVWDSHHVKDRIQCYYNDTIDPWLNEFKKNFDK